MENQGRKYIFVINPVAGKGKGKALAPKIEKECKKRNWNYEIRYTEEGKAIREQLKDVQDAIIYAVGGDGLVSQILQAIVGTNNRLAVIPAGSGNDFYKTIQKLEDGEHQIDVGKINDQYFINVACLGIDAEVANNIDKLRDSKIPTSQLYNASIVYTFFQYHPKKVDFKTSIKEIQAEPMIISICNGAFYGGGYKIAPKSSLTDGIFDVYYADKFQKFHMLSLLPKLRKGNHEGKRYIHKFRTNHVEITTEEEVVFNVDGEKLKGKHFVLDILPKAICLAVDNEFVQKIYQEEKNIEENPPKGKLVGWKQKWRKSKIGQFVKAHFRNTILVLFICYILLFMSLAFLKSEHIGYLETLGKFTSMKIQTEMPFSEKVNSLQTIGLGLFVFLFIGKEFLCVFILLALFAILKGLTGNTKASCLILFVFSFFFEIMNYIVRQLRGSGITIADIFALQTALNVADKGMSINVDGYFIAGLILAAIVFLLILALKKPEKKMKIWRTY